MSSDQSWKTKYFRELESAERQEEQWKAERNSLERMLVRTSLASEGQTPELDALLARVRSDIRKKQIEVANWQDLQDQIDREVAQLDDLDQESEPVPDLLSNVPNTGSPSQRLRIARRVGHLLSQLLNQVSLEPKAEMRAKNLQRALLSSDSWDELREGLNQVADLIVAAVTRSQREFEAFLKRLDERLESLKENFSVQSTAQTGRQAAAASLDQSIREKIEQVGLHIEKIEQGDDLQDLKQSVSQHLESIGQAVEHFRAEETEREKMLTEQLMAMQEKMVVMEAHSEQMQGQVRKERERAMTDLLTQLPNREAWQERLSFEFTRWKRYQYPVTVGMLDIDLFKRVNDSYGHKAGDRVLQLVAREVKNRLRDTDFVARFGGEEFVLIFPETTPDDAKVAVDKLRNAISALPFHFGGQPVTITFSAGLAAYTAGDTEESVFIRADRALYLAKGAGRDCVKVGQS